jgi:hypothetical protein
LWDSNPTPQVANGSDAQAIPSAPDSGKRGGFDPSSLGDPRVETTVANNAPLSGTLAFEAKLSPVAEQPSGADVTAAPQVQPASSQSLPSQASQIPPRALPLSNGWPAGDDANGARGARDLKLDRTFEADAVSASTGPSLSTHSSGTQNAPATAQTSNTPAVARMQAADAPPVPASSNQTIAVNVSDGNGGAGIHLRFLERGGEIHVSVRSSDAGVAQDLRAGVSDLVGRLEHAGIRAEVSTASSGGSQMQREAQDGQPDRRGSGRNSSEPDDSEQNSRSARQARWMEVMGDSTDSDMQPIRSN